MREHITTLVSSALFATACMEPPEPPPQTSAPRSIVSAPPSPKNANTKSTPRQCGEVVYANTCPADRHEKFECFVHALEECELATLRIKKTTAQGGKVVHDFAIKRAADGSCGVEGRYDESGDKFGGKAGVTTSRCKGVKPLETPGCTTLGMDGC